MEFDQQSEAQTTLGVVSVSHYGTVDFLFHTQRHVFFSLTQNLSEFCQFMKGLKFTQLCLVLSPSVATLMLSAVGPCQRTGGLTGSETD